ncbi:hypothetical protein ACFYYL_35570 [Actinomadura geliboluensis]|uniref:hypothetical protein n=1 Tax=Actinomadura geliboluensis TaxID=882440 RepID=UPI0036C5E0DA
MNAPQRTPIAPCPACVEPAQTRDRYRDVGLRRRWNEDAVARGGDGPAGAARLLLRAALDAGGHDNVTVAVLPSPSPGAGRERGR